MVMLWKIVMRHVTPSGPTMREIQPPWRKTPYFTRKFLIYDDKVRLNDSLLFIVCYVL